MMDMLQSICDKLNMGTGAIQVALVQYGTVVKTIQALTSSRNSVNTQITYLRSHHMAATTHTGDALSAAITVAQTTSRSPAYAKVLMLFTDGITNGGVDPVPIANNLRLWQNATYPTNPTKPTTPWKLVAAGLGDQLYLNNNAGWNQVVSLNYDPAQTLAASFSNLNSLVSVVVTATCNV